MKNNKIMCIFTALALVSLLFVAYTAVFGNADGVQIDNEPVTDFGDNWQVRRTDGRVYVANLPVQTDAAPNETVTITKRLSKEFEANLTLAFRTTHQTVEVYANDTRLYDFGVKHRYSILKSPGTAWHLVRIPEQMGGCVITMKFSSPYPAHAKNLCGILLGTKSACVFSILRQNLLGLILCVAIMLFGLILSITYIIFKRKFLNNPSMLYLGLFAITVSLWSSTETQLAQFLINNVLVIYMLVFLPLMLVPLPMLLFVKEAYNPKKGWLLDAAAVLSIINFIGSALLQLTGILDLAQSVISSHIVIIVSLIAILIAILAEPDGRKNKSFRSFMSAIFVLAGFIVSDYLRYYVLKLSDSAQFFRIGFLIFLIILSAETLEKYFYIAELSSEARTYKRLAYLDILTGLKNRTAFDNELEKLASRPESKNVMLVEFDLNDLKVTNDHYGHKVGDENIVAAASAIKSSFKRYGRSYRIGGDEFAAILKNCTDQNFMECIALMQRAIERHNESNSNQLAIAYGYAHFEKSLDKNYYDTLNRADRLMYQHKHKMKAVTAI